MRFEEILPKIREGAWARRSAWSGTKAISVLYPSAASDMTLPFIYYRTGEPQTVPWVAKQRDLLEDDWVVVDR